ncbi:MAG: DNA-processing protein DprA [Muribaculaceae bacterium]|nr:DNA-processing protein DprA [Muribaculaceae bacterium]
MNTEPDTDIICKVALSFLKGATLNTLRSITDAGISLPDLFSLPDATIAARLHSPLPHHLDSHHRAEALRAAQKEMTFIDRHHIQVHYADDPSYPMRLSQIQSPPPVIFQLGATDLNTPHPISIVGTRKMTPYGAEATRRITAELAGYFPDLCVISGLAYGVDSVAHTTAIDSRVTTIAVVAHGLDTLYPAQHRDLARRIIASGGSILSQYPSGVRPFRANFLERNRIVAGLADATIIIESEIKGGAMSTARHAFEANREVLALPGRTIDPISAGCNHLIRTHRASLLTSASDITELTGWQPLGISPNASPGQPRSLFPELDGDAHTICEYLRSQTVPRLPDEIHHHTSIPMPRLIALLSDLEFDGLLLRHPGNRYTAIT